MPYVGPHKPDTIHVIMSVQNEKIMEKYVIAMKCKGTSIEAQKRSSHRMTYRKHGQGVFNFLRNLNNLC